MKQIRFHHLLLCVALLLSASACENDETAIGDSLQDPGTLFQAQFDTISGDNLYAVTLLDDSLQTSGNDYTRAIIGHYADDVFGTVSSCILTQVAPVNTSGIDFTDQGSNTYTIDSVALCLAVSDVFPDDNDRTLHITVDQLTRPIANDSSYYSTDDIATALSLYDQTLTVHPTDSLVLRLMLNNSSIAPLLKQRFESQDAFKESFKGLKIQLADGSDPVMLTVNFANSKTIMKVYYTHQYEETITHDTISFIVGHVQASSPHKHFCHIDHTYSTTALAPLANGSLDSLDGQNKLYLEPLGGTCIYLNIDNYVKQFHAAHPHATINYAELLLPTTGDIATEQPAQVIAYKRYSNGYMLPISDNNQMLSPYAAGGFDGTYHDDLGYYRLRISQYLQELMRDNADYGMVLYLNGRRSDARRTVINGTKHTSNPIRITIIYSE
ncbi:MAG: DUF4270 family protein [Bacteroidales bacterium]|nr:DUF4270 family protein [Bacteroidales bacterium]